MLEPGWPREKTERRATVASESRRLTAIFKAAGLATPGLDARLLVAEACGLCAEDAIVNSGACLTPAQVHTLSYFAERRLHGEPVSRILGWREFWGMRFNLSPATLDPRPESELLIDIALEHVRSRGSADRPLRVLDIGTGTGCLLAALLRELPASYGIGVDRSEEALIAARDNLSRLGLFNRASLLCQYWLSAVCGVHFDVIVCNPPYIEAASIETLATEVRRYDPRLALDGGRDGLDAYRQVIPQAWSVLRDGGILVLETGCNQGQAVRALIQQAGTSTGFTRVQIRTDLSGTERAVAGVRQL